MDKPKIVMLDFVRRGHYNEPFYFAQGGDPTSRDWPVVPGSYDRDEVERALVAAGYHCTDPQVSEYRL